MKPQPDLMASSQKNPDRVKFYEKDGQLRISIHADPHTIADRKARDDDKVKYKRYYDRFVEFQALLNEAREIKPKEEPKAKAPKKKVAKKKAAKKAPKKSD